MLFLIFCKSEPFVDDAAKIFAKIDAGELEGFISAITITNIYYIIRKVSGKITAQDAIAQIMTDLHICAVDREILEQAITLNFQDFEDAVQCACGIANEVDAIITRDPSGFVNAGILVIPPGALGNIMGK